MASSMSMVNKSNNVASTSKSFGGPMYDITIWYVGSVMSNRYRCAIRLKKNKKRGLSCLCESLIDSANRTTLSLSDSLSDDLSLELQIKSS